MNIALTSLVSETNDVENNLRRIEALAAEAVDDGADLILFGEAFLQGPDALSFDYHDDILNVARSTRSREIALICSVARKHDVAIGFGFYENDHGGIYSSYLMIDRNGDIVGKAQRMTSGWMSSHACSDYRQGRTVARIRCNNQTFAVLIGDDLWDDRRLMPMIEADAEVDGLICPVRGDDAHHVDNDDAVRTQVLAHPVLVVTAWRPGAESFSLRGAHIWEQGKEGVTLKSEHPGLFYVDWRR